jgi:hypothetical protein
MHLDQVIAACQRGHPFNHYTRLAAFSHQAVSTPSRINNPSPTNPAPRDFGMRRYIPHWPSLTGWKRAYRSGTGAQPERAELKQITERSNSDDKHPPPGRVDSLCRRAPARTPQRPARTRTPNVHSPLAPHRRVGRPEKTILRRPWAAKSPLPRRPGVGPDETRVD